MSNLRSCRGKEYLREVGAWSIASAHPEGSSDFRMPVLDTTLQDHVVHQLRARWPPQALAAIHICAFS